MPRELNDFCSVAFERFLVERDAQAGSGIQVKNTFFDGGFEAET